MKRSHGHAALALVSLVSSLIACAGGGEPTPLTEPGAPAPTTTSSTPPPPPACSGSACNPPPVTEPVVDPLHVRFFGVDGFLLERGNEAVMTVPLFTRPTMIEASTGIPVTSDAALVASSLPTAKLPNVVALVSGHAHYDHLLDAPAVMTLAPNATLYTNRSGRNLLAAWAPDRTSVCADKPAQAKTIARSRVVAVDDTAASTVDYTSCPDKKPAGAPLDGKWMQVPGAHVRVLAICSEHPAQIGPIHYGEGDVVDEKCTPETNMNEWKEGETVALLIDFLDPKTDQPLYRVFYEDAPTNTPIGHVPTKFLAEKRVDLALMCVGTYDKVDDASPRIALDALAPRYAIGGHWEDFFVKADQPIKPIIFLDVAAWATKARAALPPETELPLIHNTKAATYRAALPQPGDTFDILPAKP
jgi:L-ascorbate metabolism protein UlaG (beta-lactamase superfamily)